MLNYQRVTSFNIIELIRQLIWPKFSPIMCEMYVFDCIQALRVPMHSEVDRT